MPTPAQPIIAIRQVTKRFPGVIALQDVSLEILPGELHAICGENGAGKSTLMKILSGVIAEFEGELLLGGKPARFRSTRDAEAAGVSIIHQELNLVEQLSAAANVFLGREIRGWLGLRDDAAMEQAAAQLLRELECDVNPRTLAGQLRVGDQQLLEIAKALSLQSDILIMDEPTSALTESEVSRLYRVIERLRKRGVTILYISHKMDEVFHLADRITVLRDGKTVKTLNKSETNAQQITHLMVGREIDAIDFGGERQTKEVLLKVSNLSLPWPGHARGYRLKDISFELRRGEVLGFAGLMGAGRTELLECLFGASEVRPQGSIELLGRELSLRHPVDACREGIALVTEDRKRLGIFAAMNVGQNISLCTLDKTGALGVIDGKREWAMATEVSQRLAVKTAGLSAAITSLSGGNQQKCIIGRWLLTNPRVLLLDDPTRGVDVGAKAELYRLIDKLCREGIGVIMTSSELPELLTVCDRILVLSEGNLTASFQRAEATEHKILEAATMGRAKAS
ncbi:sugar ABC transporter ATP-binding protein [Anatilimnocola floriformis]|uniref:sugar ABC transporter ATP-binding protein n=1 Tax=Anatilimnocola floriformis TaxID=2948575 RepID=UPI0020C522B2|nr:sugar ABC transporter ATP-binding protein [Anatilimnocola floriformis]